MLFGIPVKNKYLWLSVKIRFTTVFVRGPGVGAGRCLPDVLEGVDEFGNGVRDRVEVFFAEFCSCVTRISPACEGLAH